MWKQQHLCNGVPQTLTDGERYLEVPIPQEFVEVFEKPDDSQERTNTIEQIQHELGRMNDANILFQHHSRTWWDEPPVDYRTEEEWLEELEQGRSETPNRNDFYPGAGFEPKCGIVNKMIGDVNSVDYNVNSRHFLDDDAVAAIIASEPCITQLELRRGIRFENQLFVAPPQCCGGFHQHATSQPAVDIITANHGSAFFPFETSTYILPITASAAASRIHAPGTGGSNQGGFDLQLNAEGFQFGRVFSRNLRFFSCYSEEFSYGWNREYVANSDFGKYVPDQGFYRPGPWSANPMPKWIDTNEFALSPYHSQRPQDNTWWSTRRPQDSTWKSRPGGFEGQFHRDEGAARLYMAFNYMVKEEIRSCFLRLKRERGYGYGQLPPLNRHPSKSAGFGGPKVSLAEKSPSVEDTGGAHEDGSHGNCEPSAGLQASSPDTLYKSNMIQFGVSDSNHELFYKNWDKQACKLWFFDNGRQMTPAQINSQAIYLHCTQGVHLAKPQAVDGQCCYVDKDDERCI